MVASFRYALLRAPRALAFASLVGCGGITAVASSGDAAIADAGANDTAGSDAGRDGQAIDASTDAPGADVADLICDGTGLISGESYRQCRSDSECTFYSHQTDCCGSTVITGVTIAALAAVETCESIWDKHFPGCGCAAGPPKTDDGKTTTFGAKPTVKCGDFTSGGGICLTSTP